MEATVPAALAIVIPAYKAEFLGNALDSLLDQTSQGFHVYVGDDASPQPLAAICEARRGAGLSLSYHRFAENRGARELVSQWNRCVQLSRGEEWVWLFSDDDVAEPRCVEQFFAAIKNVGPEVNVLRFNSVTVDRHGAVTEPHPPHPARETVAAFAYDRLTFRRQSYAPDHVFRRAAFDRHGGFVPFPFALGSDDASWITFAGDGPLVTIPEALVFWRLSGQNVSHLPAGQAAEKLLALADVSRWLRGRFAGCHFRPPDATADVDFAALIQDWFTSHALDIPDLSPVETWRLAGELERRALGNRFYWSRKFLGKALARQGRRARRVFQRLRRRPPQQFPACGLAF